MTTSTITKIGPRHQITIPKSVFKALDLKVGDYVHLEADSEKKKAQITPSQIIPKDQAWFWTPEWQAMEREADEDIKNGRVKKFDNVKNLIADLNS